MAKILQSDIKPLTLGANISVNPYANAKAKGWTRNRTWKKLKNSTTPSLVLCPFLLKKFVNNISNKTKEKNIVSMTI